MTGERSNARSRLFASEVCYLQKPDGLCLFIRLFSITQKQMVNSHTRLQVHNIEYRHALVYAIARPSVVCNVRAPYSGDSNFRQYFYGIRYLGSTNIHGKFHGDRPRGTPPPGELNIRWVAKYSDFGPIDGYISETVQDRR